MKYFWITGLFLLFFSTRSIALEEREKLWLGISKQASFPHGSPWLYSILSQLRFINESHAWQTLLFEGGLGRTFSGKRVWLGYRWSGHDPNNQFYQENLLFQQFNFPIKANELIYFASRSRLEEIVRGNQNQVALRFRKKISLEINSLFMKKANPYVYNEFFFRLNKTRYTASNVLTENRLFLGFNVYLSNTHYLEIGYINQYQYKTPLSTQNQMNHILSLIYNF